MRVLLEIEADSIEEVLAMEDSPRIRCATSDTDDLVKQVAHQRLIKGFRREEEEYNRSHLLYGNDHIERDLQKAPRPG